MDKDSTNQILINFTTEEDYLKALNEVCVIPVEHTVIEETLEKNTIYNEAEKYIIEVIENEYKDYPDLKDYELRIIEMYLKEYKHISSNKKYFNLTDTTPDHDIINMVFEHMKEIWEKIMVLPIKEKGK